jgi:phosphohistidine phosphatase
VDVYVIRHADALPLGEQGIMEDAQRPLSDEGEAQVKRVAAGLQRLGIRLPMVVTSPLLRARQTGEILVREWAAPAPNLTVCEDLAPGGKRRKVARFLQDWGGDIAAVIGHQPDLGEWTAWLVGSSKAQLDLAKAGVAYIVCPDGPAKGGGVLKWMVTPEWFGG